MDNVDGPDGRERVDRLADHIDKHKRFARDYSDHNQLICSMCALIAEVQRLRAERAPITYAPAEIMAERDEALAEVEQRLEQWESLHTTYTHLCDRYSKLEAENTRLREEISEYIKATKKLAYSNMDTLEWKP